MEWVRLKSDVNDLKSLVLSEVYSLKNKWLMYFSFFIYFIGKIQTLLFKKFIFLYNESSNKEWKLNFTFYFDKNIK